MATVYANTNDVVAHLPGVVGAVRDKARDGADRAETILRAHRHAGHSRITVTSGDVDAFVSLDDTRGAHAAAAIEYGRSGGPAGGATQGVGALAGAFP
jgi:hypothetical protein